MQKAYASSCQSRYILLRRVGVCACVDTPVESCASFSNANGTILNKAADIYNDNTKFIDKVSLQLWIPCKASD